MYSRNFDFHHFFGGASSCKTTLGALSLKVPASASAPGFSARCSCRRCALRFTEAASPTRADRSSRPRPYLSRPHSALSPRLSDERHWLKRSASARALTACSNGNVFGAMSLLERIMYTILTHPNNTRMSVLFLFLFYIFAFRGYTGSVLPGRNVAAPRRQIAPGRFP